MFKIKYFFIILFIVILDRVYYIPSISKVLFVFLFLYFIYLVVKGRDKNFISLFLFLTLCVDSQAKQFYSGIEFFSWGSDVLMGLSFAILSMIPVAIYIYKNKRFINYSFDSIYIKLMVALIIYAGFFGLINLIQNTFTLKFYFMDLLKALSMVIFYIFASIAVKKNGKDFVINKLLEFTILKYISGLVIFALGWSTVVSNTIVIFSVNAINYYILVGLFFYYLYQLKIPKAIATIGIVIFYVAIYFQRGVLVTLAVLLVFIPIAYHFSQFHFQRSSKGIKLGKLIIGQVILLVIMVAGIVSMYADVNLGGNTSSNLISREHIASEIRNLNIVADNRDVRTVEFINIVNKNLENPLTALFGQGFGGYFEQDYAYFRDWEHNESAFSIEELKSGKYFFPHSFFNVIALKFGIVGFVAWFIVLIASVFRLRILKKEVSIRHLFVIIPAIVWCPLMFFFNAQVIQICGFYYAVIFNKESKDFKNKEKLVEESF